MLIRWASFKNLEDVKKEVATFMPNKQNPVVVRFVTRSELAAIPKDRYSVRIIKVRVPRMKSGESDGEEEIQVAITDTLLLAKQLKKIRSKIRDLKEKRTEAVVVAVTSRPPILFMSPLTKTRWPTALYRLWTISFTAKTNAPSTRRNTTEWNSAC